MVTPKDIEAAHLRIAPHLHQTPVLTSRSLNQLANAELYFKCENFQRTGAFKFRGAYNTLSNLTAKEKAAGVVTWSGSNHAQGAALAGKILGIKSTIIMLLNAVPTK